VTPQDPLQKGKERERIGREGKTPIATPGLNPGYAYGFSHCYRSTAQTTTAAKYPSLPN